MNESSSVAYNYTEETDIFVSNEVDESDLRNSLIEEITKVRQEKGLSQRQLEELSGVKQPIIARMENGTSIPNLNTILKLLVPLGKTLYIGDIE